MCGIVGTASIRPVGDRSLLTVMRERLTHRGPDGSGDWWSADGRVGLGHRRLAVIDLSATGCQPMSDASGRLHVTFNGEIYNYRELRAELESEGHAFRSRSDTEVLLEAYARWGRECVPRLHGMFAFALFDERRQELLLARDRAGEKPLFYRLSEGRIAFASELKALLADPACPRKLDPHALGEYLAYGFVPGDHCLLRGVHKLPPAHAAVFDLRSAQWRVWRYWTLPQPSPRQDATPEELAAELERLLADSVRCQLVADVPVGILLSGGLDSSLITALAARSAGARVRTFTITFPHEPTYDEAAHARMVAEHFGTEHVELAAEPSSIDLVPALARQFDEPVADSSMIPTYLVSRLVREHATVALGGDGGDELFGGYQLYTTLLGQARARRLLPAPLRTVLRLGAGALLPLGLPGRNWLLELTANPQQRIAHAYMFDAWARKRLLNRDLAAKRGGPQPEDFKSALCDPTLTALQDVTRADFHTYLPEDILVKVDRASMLTSLEVRAPWLDHRLVEFAFRDVPDHLKVQGGERKRLPRMLGRRVLPAQLDLTRKQGFGVPLERWLDKGWGGLVREVLGTASPEIFDRRAIKSLLDSQERGYHNTGRLFCLTVFELWRREYRIDA